MPRSDRTAASLPLSHELLAYYRARVEEFEEERALLIGKLEQCDVAHDEMHRLRWELRKKMDEIEDLQRALNDAHVYLYDERQQLLVVYAENDALRIQELDDRRKIKQLLALTQPVNQEITYFPERAPERMRRFPKEQETARAEAAPLGSSTWAAGAAPSSPGRSSAEASAAASGKTFPKSRRRPEPGASASAGAGAGAGAGASSGAGGAAAVPGAGDVAVPSGGARVLRTVFMPNDQTDTMLLTIESLRSQLAERERLHAEQLEAYKEDRRRRMEEERVRAEHDRAALDDALRRAEHTQAMLTRATKEYLTFRHNAQLTQRLLKEETEALGAELRAATDRTREVTRAAEVDVRTAERTAASAADEIAAALRKQVLAKEDALRLLTAKADAEREEASQTVGALRAANKRLTERCERAEQRAAHEREGFQTEIAQLRAELRAVEADVYRRAARAATDGAAGGERELEMLNAALATAGRSKALTGMLGRLKARMRGVEDEVFGLGE